jgi:hypothetical protein
MNTYFVLNKKDRSGINQSRPFQVVLREMKRQEIHEAKKKQSKSLKGENQQNPLPIKNGFDHSNMQNTSKPTEPVKTEQNNRDDNAIEFGRNSLSKPMMNHDQPVRPSDVTTHSIKSFQSQSRSRTCELF